MEDTDNERGCMCVTVRPAVRQLGASHNSSLAAPEGIQTKKIMVRTPGLLSSVVGRSWHRNYFGQGTAWSKRFMMNHNTKQLALSPCLLSQAESKHLFFQKKGTKPVTQFSRCDSIEQNCSRDTSGF